MLVGWAARRPLAGSRVKAMKPAKLVAQCSKCRKEYPLHLLWRLRATMETNHAGKLLCAGCRRLLFRMEGPL